MGREVASNITPDTVGLQEGIVGYSIEALHYLCGHVLQLWKVRTSSPRASWRSVTPESSSGMDGSHQGNGTDEGVCDTQQEASMIV